LEEPTLEELRKRIDCIDRAIIKLLEERIKVCRDIAKCKLKLGLPIEDPQRENIVLKRAGIYEDVFKEIIKLCKKVQEGWFMVKFNTYDFFNTLNSMNVPIRMDVGQVDIPPHPELLKVLKDEIHRLEYTSYRGINELREKIAEVHKVDINEVIVIPGAKFGIAAMIYRAKRVGLIAPYWPGYMLAIEFFKRKYSTLETSFEEQWQPQLTQIDKSVDTLIINYPNNPTGITLGKEKIKELMEVAQDRKITIVSDEIYRDLVYEGEEFSILKYNIENSISVYSLSKTFSMPGLRLGYAIGDKQLVEVIAKFIQASYTSAPVFAQKAAIRALELRESIAKKLRDIFKKRIELLLKYIDKEKYDYVKPTGAFYAFLKIKSGISGVDLAYKLMYKGVGVFPGIAFGDSYDNYIRISLVCPEDKLVEGFKRMNEVVD